MKKMSVKDKYFIKGYETGYEKAKIEVFDDIDKLIENAKNDINMTVLDREFILNLLQKIQSKLKERHR